MCKGLVTTFNLTGIADLSRRRIRRIEILKIALQFKKVHSVTHIIKWRTPEVLETEISGLHLLLGSFC